MSESEEGTPRTGWFQFGLRLLFVLITAVCVILALEFRRDRKPRDTFNASFFPMAVGNKWVYASGKEDVAFEVLRTEKLADTNVYVVRRTIGDGQVEFKVAVEEDGIYIHQEGTKEFHPPLRQFAFFARLGDEWKWQGKVSGKLQNHRFEHLVSKRLKCLWALFQRSGFTRAIRRTTNEQRFGWPGISALCN